ncbi:MAG: hypothetical protein ISN29_00650 [Gammaproteobacteria bacterium AqS3]|nr:hypothetical protein [Gammaproteobacteria bacterium AqS3]
MSQYRTMLAAAHDRAVAGGQIAELLGRKLSDKPQSQIFAEFFDALNLSGAVNVMNRMKADSKCGKEEFADVMIEYLTTIMDGRCASSSVVGWRDIQTSGDAPIEDVMIGVADSLCDDDVDLTEDERTFARNIGDHCRGEEQRRIDRIKRSLNMGDD